ncbi:MAG: RNA polymerase sigma factor, partial [Candidatus Binatia bacterium]
MTDEEKTLIAGCVKTDKPAWDEFVQQYSKLVYHTIRKTLALHHAEVFPDLVEDLFQEVFLALVKDNFSQLRRFRGDNGCTLASWLRMITARRTIDHLRKLKKPIDPVEHLLCNSEAEQAADEANDDQFQRLTGAIANLQP